MHHSFLAQAFIYLLAAIIAVPVAKRLGLGSVLGYLIAGAAIGPFALQFIGDESGDVMHYAEFGVVMMMFVIGLELRPKLLWRLRGPILGTGGSQVLATAVIIAAATLLIGTTWKEAIAIGLILALSSTAIVLQSLAERGQLKTEAGKSAFAVLLFQDIAVIPILAILPILASRQIAATSDHHGPQLANWQHALLVLGAVALIVGGGRYLVRPIFRYIAATKLREVFTATALTLVIGIALLMQSVGLSPALGTFLAGVMLSDSEYRHELESDIEPFKGLLLGVFFIAVGASLDFALIAAQPIQIATWVTALILLKMLVLFTLARISRMPGQDISLFTLALAQGGEFCFVLLSFAHSNHVLSDTLTKPLTATVALSMAITPFLLMAHEKLLLPRLQRKENERPMDSIESEESQVIIAGFGRFGLTVGRLLRMSGLKATVLDLDSEQIDFLRQIGFKVFYGDASRVDMLTAAGADSAKLFVLAIDDEPKALEIVDTVKKHFPHLTIIARAADRTQTYEMIQRGVPHVYREASGTSLEMATKTLSLLGIPEAEAQRASQHFHELDEQSIHTMVEIWKEHEFGEVYITTARQQIAEMERLFRTDTAASR
ncbi:potassium transporter [Phragmitibacter flavus]|uniref:Potassium transporter n=1 Tax=Phragmitibacter flavus TaxID=2576071 RepID=A0A5R8KAX5_9BACT|nr:monovalent cation:proton antiporter-2 (CPA2) family protein [Phragmitibacter flavus]TLD69468.1 potassium transporter [Phragmitibacter flavus]